MQVMLPVILQTIPLQVNTYDCGVLMLKVAVSNIKNNFFKFVLLFDLRQFRMS